MHTSTIISAPQIKGAIGPGQYFELQSRAITTFVEDKLCLVFVCMAATRVYAAIVISALQIDVISAGGDGLELQSLFSTTRVENKRCIVFVCIAAFRV